LKISQTKDVSISKQFHFSQRVQNVKLKVICGPMFSSKTKTLIQSIQTAQEAGKTVLVCQPNLDTRYSKNAIQSHDMKAEIEALSVSRSKEILDYFHHADMVAIDEAQFFDQDIVPVCLAMLKAGKDVLIAGLDLDYRAQPFGAMPELMSIADEVIKLNSVCSFCSGKARYSRRLSSEKGIVVVGEKDKYVPLCRACYHELGAV
jgi:thymidine kinase